MHARLLLIATLVLTSCATPTTRQAPTVVHSTGFLSNYSRLRPGAEGEAKLVYRAAGANLGQYTKLLLDRVVVVRQPNAAVPAQELQQLADLLYGALYVRLRTYYVMVDVPGPDTLRVRAALTEATASNPTLDTWSNVGPIVGTVSSLKKMATGTNAFVGAASVEGEVLDSQTGTVLLAAIDRRVGTKTLAGASDPWGDVKDAFNVWADAVVQRLQAMGGPTQPVPYWAQPRT